MRIILFITIVCTATLTTNANDGYKKLAALDASSNIQAYKEQFEGMGRNYTETPDEIFGAVLGLKLVLTLKLNEDLSCFGIMAGFNTLALNLKYKAELTPWILIYSELRLAGCTHVETLLALKEFMILDDKLVEVK